MGEIKSTLELALEKTKGLTLSQEEREKVREEEELKKAEGLALRLHEGRLRPAELDREIEQARPRDQDKFRRLIAWGIIALMDLSSPDANKEKESLERILGSQAERLWRLIEEAQAAYLLEAERQKEADIRQQLASLAKLGILGSALRPKCKTKADQGPFKEKLKRFLT